jgi:hypothetical protein
VSETLRRYVTVTDCVRGQGGWSGSALERVAPQLGPRAAGRRPRGRINVCAVTGVGLFDVQQVVRLVGYLGGEREDFGYR